MIYKKEQYLNYNPALDLSHFFWYQVYFCVNIIILIMFHSNAQCMCRVCVNTTIDIVNAIFGKNINDNMILLSFNTVHVSFVGF